MLQRVAVLLPRPSLGFLWCKGESPKEFQHMMRMVAHLEFLADDLSNASSGPQIGRKPGGLRTLYEDACKRFHLCLGQLERSPGRRCCPQTVEAVALDDRFPSPYRRRRHFQRSNHVDILLAGQKQSARSKTPSLLLLFGSKCSLHVRPYATTCKSVHYLRDGQ